VSTIGAPRNTVAQVLELRAAESPTSIAFWRHSEDKTWEPITWHEFFLRVTSLRNALHAAGLRKGDRLALIAPASLDWELLHHAALAMGVVVVGMDAHDLPARIAAQVEQADITAFATTHPAVLSRVGAQRLGDVRFVLDLVGGGELPSPAHGLTWPELNRLGESVKTVPPSPSADDCATIIFTSGTTGEPKGIAYSHGQVCLAIDAICSVFGFVDQRSRLLCWLPLSNLFQRMVNLAGMRNGAATYLLGDPRQVMAVVATASPDIFVGVPRFYEKLYQGICDQIATQSRLRRWLIESAWAIGRRASKIRLEKTRISPWLACARWAADRLVLRRIRSVMGDRLRCMVSGSAPLPKNLLVEFHALGWLVLEAYGLSENVLPMAMNRPDDFRFGTVGRPLPGNQIQIGSDGVISVRGPGMFHGYLDPSDPLPFDGEGFYATGDYGGFDGDGFLSLTGRTNELIKTSTGRRIAPATAEAELRRVPGIDQAVLIGSGRRCLVAICSTTIPASVQTSTRGSLEAALRDQVAMIGEPERPRAIGLLARAFSVERGELTPNLKLRRLAIENQYANLVKDLYESIDRDPLSSPMFIWRND
jgi:long-chain acyl-CoA synthetase